MTHRSKTLTDILHGAPCFADFPHECTSWMGCEPAHSDSHIFGRGIGHKSNDWACASMCGVAHKMITASVGGASMSREDKFDNWLRAYAKTQEWLWEQGAIKLNPARRVSA